MPDLGIYTVEVLSAYGITLVAIAVLTLASLRRGARARRRLADAEARQEAHP